MYIGGLASWWASVLDDRQWEAFFLLACPPNHCLEAFSSFLQNKNLPFSILGAEWGRQLGLLLFSMQTPAQFPGLSLVPLLAPGQHFSASALANSWARYSCAVEGCPVHCRMLSRFLASNHWMPEASPASTNFFRPWQISAKAGGTQNSPCLRTTALQCSRAP